MRLLIAIALAALLTACAATPKQPNPIAARAGSGIIIAGTLSLGACEMSLAAQYTRATVALQKATRRLNDGRMTLPTARLIEQKATKLIETLDSVCPLERDGSFGDAADARDAAARLLPIVEVLVGETK